MEIPHYPDLTIDVNGDLSARNAVRKVYVPLNIYF